MAESAVPIRRTKPQLQLFIPWCARGNWHERLYESMSRTTIRDVPSNQPRFRLSTGESCRIVDRWPRAE